MTTRLMMAGIARVLTVPGATMAKTARMDAEGNGKVTKSGCQQVHPDMQEGTFASVDTDASATLSTAEIDAARDAGILPGESSGG
ncbi:EF-hand domain-containing protein [Roseovarius salinarum]|uniref:calcium-binding protein n=1 Tax=Roseovarius salinarum TaxID=1981892 RepID=UPI000C333582|nr:calcium-binding protein [Roseovarius salinarum]